MVVNDEGKPVPYFAVGKSWQHVTHMETVNLIEAVAAACAIALARGVAIEILRMVPTSDDPNASPKRTQLMTVSPSNIDWRRVAPDHKLLVSAFARELVANVEDICPEPENEGTDK